MSPRAVVCASRSSTSASPVTVTTVAALGAVRPQPLMSSKRGSATWLPQPWTPSRNVTAQSTPTICSTRSESTTSSGAPPPPCSTTSAYRNTPITSGTIDRRNHVVSPVCAAFSNAHKQYAVIITPADTERTKPKYDVEYWPSVLRCPCEA